MVVERICGTKACFGSIRTLHDLGRVDNREYNGASVVIDQEVGPHLEIKFGNAVELDVIWIDFSYDEVVEPADKGSAR